MSTAPNLNAYHFELYLARLEVHLARLVDDHAAAKLRRAWRAIENEARRTCTPTEIEALEMVGVIEPVSIEEDDDRLIERRTIQIAAVERLRQVAIAYRNKLRP